MRNIGAETRIAYVAMRGAGVRAISLFALCSYYCAVAGAANQQVWDPGYDYNWYEKRSQSSAEKSNDGDRESGSLMFSRLRLPTYYYSPKYGKRGTQPRHPAQLGRQLMQLATGDKRHSPIMPELDINLPSRFGYRREDIADGVKRNQMRSEFDLNLPLRFG